MKFNFKIARSSLIAATMLGFLIANKSFAVGDLIELPQDELARESVLPVFDKPLSVKNRSITQNGRIEGSLFYSWAMSEPIFNVSKLGLSGYYHWSEDHALGLVLSKNSSGLSSYSKQLEEGFDLDFSRAPRPDYSMLLDYNLSAFYGKMSVTKHQVVNTVTLLTSAIGVNKYVHKMYPAGALGFGQKFYITKNLSVRLDMRLNINQAPIPFLKDRMHNSKTGGRVDPIPDYSEFTDRVHYTTNLDIGMSYLF